VFDALLDVGVRYLWRDRSVPIALVLAWLLPFGAGAEVFKWVDEDGKVHYGDSAPREREVEIVRTPAAPSDVAVLQSRSRLDGLREQAAEQHEEREKEKQAAVRAEEARKQRCLKAQRQLQVVEFQGPVFHVDERGNRVYLEDDARAAKHKDAQKAIKANCR